MCQTISWPGAQNSWRLVITCHHYYAQWRQFFTLAFVWIKGQVQVSPSLSQYNADAMCVMWKWVFVAATIPTLCTDPEAIPLEQD